MDDLSRTTWTHLFATIRNAIHLIKAFAKMDYTPFNARIKTIRSYNALKLGLSKDTTAYFLSKEIMHQTSCMGTPE